MEINDLKGFSTCDSCGCDKGIVQVLFDNNYTGQLILCWDCLSNLLRLIHKHIVI